MIDAGEKSAEEFAVRADAAGRHAAEARAMIAALAPDQRFLARYPPLPIRNW
jgi:hypothetical protein